MQRFGDAANVDHHAPLVAPQTRCLALGLRCGLGLRFGLGLGVSRRPAARLRSDRRLYARRALACAPAVVNPPRGCGSVRVEGRVLRFAPPLRVTTAVAPAGWQLRRPSPLYARLRRARGRPPQSRGGAHSKRAVRRGAGTERVAGQDTPRRVSQIQSERFPGGRDGRAGAGAGGRRRACPRR